ncbi:unnamed protein product [Rhizopus stolonifer]
MHLLHLKKLLRFATTVDSRVIFATTARNWPNKCVLVVGAENTRSSSVDQSPAIIQRLKVMWNLWTYTLKINIVIDNSADEVDNMMENSSSTKGKVQQESSNGEQSTEILDMDQSPSPIAESHSSMEHDNKEDNGQEIGNTEMEENDKNDKSSLHRKPDRRVDKMMTDNTQRTGKVTSKDVERSLIQHDCH